MLADVTGVSLKNFSTARWTFAKWFFACEIDFGDRLSGLSFLFYFWLALFEFEAYVFFVGQHEECFERSAFARNETVKQSRPAGFEQLLHLLILNWALQNHFTGPEVARFVWAD